MDFPPECDGCPQRPHVKSFIPRDQVHSGTKLIAWGEMGGSDEAAQGRGFVGPSGRVLRRNVRRLGLHIWSAWPNEPKLKPAEEEMACANAVLCRGSNNEFPGHRVAKECLLRHGVGDWSKPWLLCGANATEALTGYRLPPLKTRGSFLPVHEGPPGKWAVTTLHPAYLLKGYEDGAKGKSMDHLEPLLSLDAARAIARSEPLIPKIRLSQTGNEPHMALMGTKAKVISIDIEGRDGVPTVLGVAWETEEEGLVVWSMPWSETARGLLDRAIHHYGMLPIFHNAAYDVDELRQAGVRPPEKWVDTINMAACVDPSIPKALQSQVLSWVPGTVAWKGLINHKQGYEYEDETVRTYRRLWTEVLNRLNRRVPSTPWEWYLFYNALDTSWTLGLATAQKATLQKQGRYAYYSNVLAPLQAPLLDMGLRGMPADPDRLRFHLRATQRLQRMAKGILTEAAKVMLSIRLAAIRTTFQDLTQERKALHEKKDKRVKFPKADALAKARAIMRRAEAALKEGFNFDSTPQRRALLYDWLKLPEIRDRKTKGPSTNDKAIESFIKRLSRRDLHGNPKPTIKPKQGTIEEAIRTLKAMEAGKKWAVWDRSYLTPMLKQVGDAPQFDEHGRRPRVRTQYSLHRADSGRLASGSDDSDVEKKVKRQQLQNVPKKLRDAIKPDRGMVMVGGDWAGLEWAISMWYCSKISGPGGLHEQMLQKFWEDKFDPHRYLASHAFDRPEADVSDKQRQACKAYTHGYFFGGTETGLAKEAGHPASTGHVVCSAHDRAFRGQKFRHQTVERAKRQHFIQTPLGWCLYFWGWKPKPTEILGNTVQATAADICKVVLRDLFETSPEFYEILTTTHDSYLYQVPEPEIDRAKVWLKAKMEQPISWLDNRQWRADVNTGDSWRAVS